MNLKQLKSLSIRKIKGKVREIRSQLPSEVQNRITYSKNFTLSLSNYCQNQCGYCVYNYKVPKLEGEENRILIEDAEINNLIQKARKFNCKEALLISGERPEIFQEVKDELRRRGCSNYLEFIIGICTNLLEINILPHSNIGLLTFEELRKLKPFNASMGLMLESTSKELLKKGGVHELSLAKKPKKRIKHIINAGKLKIPFTTGLLLGIGEDWNDRINDLFLIKEIHHQFGHIQEVIIQNFVSKVGIHYQPAYPINIRDIIKTAGIAKIIFENDIGVQVAPNLISGFEDEFIDIGVADFGGISPFTEDFINPESSWPQIEHLEIICAKKGYILKERLPIYEKYVNLPDFCSETIKKRIDNIEL